MTKLDEIKKQLDECKKLLEEYEAKSIDNGKAANRDGLWFLNMFGEPVEYQFQNDSYFKPLWVVGNIFNSYEEAEFEAEKRMVLAIVKRFASDFDPKIGKNWRIYWSHNRGEIDFEFFEEKKGSDLCFESVERAKAAIKAVGEKRFIKYFLGVKE